MRSTILKVVLPRQMNGDEAATIEAAASTAESASTAAVGTNFIINIMLSASLNQLWSMMNGLQIFVSMPLMNVKFPANANSFIVFLVDIANFDILPTDIVFEYIFTFPEDDEPYNLNF